MVEISIDENYEMTKKYCRILDDTKLEKKKTLRKLNYSYLNNKGTFTVKTICFLVDGYKLNFISQEGKDETLKNIFQEEKRNYEIIE
jgi:6-pyruvoyl-tetrahydropterin synthase